jgi:sterol desaturase/sphingolipid hydroxylase (fatty acid hydroxylase superfamily)
VFDAGEITHSLVRALGLGAAFALAVALERWRPQARLRPAWRTNLGLWALGVALTAAVCGACGWTAAAWAESRDLGLLPRLGAETLAAAALGVLALGAVSYAWHRANHRVTLLWRFHRVHHSDAAFHVTTGLRFHPGELLLAIPVRLAAVVALGVPPEGVLAFELVFGVANLLEHGNFDLPRPLEPIAQRLFVTPALHRMHHGRAWAELGTNFGTVLSLWDRLGATFRASDADRRIATGLPDGREGVAPSFGEALRLPFSGGSPRPR